MKLALKFQDIEDRGFLAGELKNKREVAVKSLALLDDATIAQITGLPLADVKALRKEHEAGVQPL